MLNRHDKDINSTILERYLISGDDNDVRLVDQPYCQTLKRYNIAHLGYMTTGSPYELTRIHQSGSCLIATTKGEGIIYTEGNWKVSAPGTATLLPPFSFNSIKAIEGKNWSFTWVKYLETEGAQPVATALSPVMGTFETEPFLHTILGFYKEVQSSNSSAVSGLWIELIHKYVLNFAQPKVEDPRLWRLWTEVEKNLQKPWKVSEMAAISTMSTEHLRRLCKRQFNRSPKQQLAFLRIRKASILLGATQQKIETIANAVGYYDPFSFSNAFKQHTGYRPSEVR